LQHKKHSTNAAGGADFWRRRGFLACLLYPLSLCFFAVTWLRITLYRLGFLSVHRLPVPVVVIGNLTVGGTGKTPLILYLVRALSEQGMHPGVVSRGYGGVAKGVQEVMADSQAMIVGDEPLLLAQRSQCPVFIGRNRAQAAQSLLAKYPDCDIILSDDGLQHYRLARDVELAVFDQRGIMNGWPLPAGPLREPMKRLSRVDAIVLNGNAVSPAPTFRGETFTMRLEGQIFRRLDQPAITCGVDDLKDRRLHAVAGIGSPQRFFDYLQTLGLTFSPHPFPDHHQYQAHDLQLIGDAILTTEKDAVKLARINTPLPVWVLPVTARVTPDLARFILEKINGSPPA